jgi:acetoin utilization protein AcuB
MYVGWSMKTNLVTVSPETSIFKAREMMDNHKISHLPVTDGKARLLGIVTDRDLKESWASPATTLSVHELTYVLQRLTVANIMTKKLITATPDMTIERAAQIIHDKKIGALPVLKNNKLVGIITTTDLMQVLLTALGMSDETTRLSMLVKDRMAALAEAGKLMHQARIHVFSIMTMPLDGHHDVWQVIMRVGLNDREHAVKTLENAGFRVITEYVEDLSSYLPF